MDIQNPQINTFQKKKKTCTGTSINKCEVLGHSSNQDRALGMKGLPVPTAAFSHRHDTGL